MTNPIMDFDGNPFLDLDRTLALRDLLTDETGLVYQIDTVRGAQGWVVRRCEDRVPAPRWGRESNIVENRNDTHTRSEFTPLVLRPALRTSLPSYLPFMLFGLFLILNAGSTLSYLFAALEIRSLPRGIDPECLTVAVELSGSFLLLVAAGAVFLPWLSSRYVVSPEGVSMQHGIIARDLVQIRYSDILSIALKQGIIERLLNIGTVQFDTAGTDEVDVSFVGIARPDKVQAHVQRQMKETREKSG